MSDFLCPVCSEKLEIKEKSYICPKNHSFDIAKKGYVNLLTGAGGVHGDDKTMVNARNAFLSRGYYSHLKEALQKLAVKYAPDSPAILDCGCGEGYYTEGIHNALAENGKQSEIFGIDISKDACSIAARRVKGGKFAVASSFHLPIENDSIDVLVNCFSPLCLEEFSRVLKKDGTFLYVVPAKKHLWSLKVFLYDNPYENEEKTEEYDRFNLAETVRAAREIHLTSAEDINNLFTMTPYFYTSPVGAKEKLLSKTELDTSADFIIYVYKRI